MVNRFAALPTAQQVRLGFLAAVEFVALILAIVTVGAFNYYPSDFYTETPAMTAATGDLSGVLGWLVILQVAAITLGVITLYRFLKPKEVDTTGGDLS